MAINPEDNIDPAKYEELLLCDENNDGTIDACELFWCGVELENVWREENCPDYGSLYCEECPW